MEHTEEVETTRPMFSVIIPNYNYGKYLPRAINSVLNQTVKDYELIVVDDGSKDDSLEVLKKFEPDVKVIAQQNSGVSVARNHGAQVSKGKYLLLFDADDELLPQALEHFQFVIQNSPGAGVFISHHLAVDEQGNAMEGKLQPEFKNRQNTFHDFLNRKFSIVHGGIVFKREVMERLKYPPGVTNGEDLVLFAQAMALYDCVNVPYPTAKIYAHAGRARDNLAAIRKVGYSTVDILFDTYILPAELMRLRNEFLTRRALSLGRAFLKGKAFQEAREAYWLAWKTSPQVFCNLTHLGRALRSWLGI